MLKRDIPTSNIPTDRRRELGTQNDDPLDDSGSQRGWVFHVGSPEDDDLRGPPADPGPGGSLGTCNGVGDTIGGPPGGTATGTGGGDDPADDAADDTTDGPGDDPLAGDPDPLAPPLSAAAARLLRAVDDAVAGGERADSMSGEGADDRFSGGGGDDALRGGDGADWLEGGRGSDLLEGGAGSDCYVFDAGFGHDCVVNYDRSDGRSDRIEFGAGIRPGDFSLARSGSDLILTRGDSGDVLTLQGYFLNRYHAVDSIQFADGTD